MAVCYYEIETIEQLIERYEEIDSEKKALLFKYSQFKFKNEQACEYAMQGLMRRIGILATSIDNIFEFCPPDQIDPISQETANSLAINLHAFVMNVFGCLDNIAWIWFYQNSLDLKRREVGLKETHKELRSTFSQNFQNQLKEFSEWLKYIEGFRNALAHRIPLYVPPFALDPLQTTEYNELEKDIWNAIKNKEFEKVDAIKSKQDKLGFFRPWMQHSFNENSQPVVFHAQILSDWATVNDLANKFFKEICL